jgi:hypothetical protein
MMRSYVRIVARRLFGGSAVDLPGAYWYYY